MHGAIFMPACLAREVTTSQKLIVRTYKASSSALSRSVKFAGASRFNMCSRMMMDPSRFTVQMAGLSLALVLSWELTAPGPPSGDSSV